MIKCPECESEKIRKHGFAITRLGKKQIYQCKKCGRLFREKNGE